jgi:hypothetical protein
MKTKLTEHDKIMFHLLMCKMEVTEQDEAEKILEKMIAIEIPFSKIYKYPSLVTNLVV